MFSSIKVGEHYSLSVNGGMNSVQVEVISKIQRNQKIGVRCIEVGNFHANPGQMMFCYPKQLSSPKSASEFKKFKR